MFGRKQSVAAYVAVTSDQLFSDIPSNRGLLLPICQGAQKGKCKVFNVKMFMSSSILLTSTTH